MEKFGYANECKECRKEARKKLNYERISEGVKLCNKCNTSKDVKEFSNDSKNTDGLSSCISCSIKHIYNVGSTFDGFIKILYYDLLSNAKKEILKLIL